MLGMGRWGKPEFGRGRRGRTREPQPEVYEHPCNENLCDESRLPVELDIGSRIDQRFHYQRMRPVFFALVFSVWDGERWVERYSVDTAHGYLHDHPTGHRTDDRRDIQPLYSQIDVQECYDQAYDLVLGRALDEGRGLA
jgi:hypothetical protein